VARLRQGLRESLRPNAQDEKQGVVITFLEENGLGQYASALFSHGFDEMETLLEATDDDLKDMGVPRGHILKLKRHLREYKGGREDEPPRFEAPPAVASRPTPVGAAAASASRASPSSSSGVGFKWEAPPRQLEATDAMKGDVEFSWKKVQELGLVQVSERLIRHFFQICPESMSCFPVEVRRRYREWTPEEEEEEGCALVDSTALKKLFGKVLNALGTMVSGLSDPSKLFPLLISLGARHQNYRVDEAYWPKLGEALNRTLAEILGDGFTPEVENAWTVVYGFTSSIMLEGLRQAKDNAGQARAFHRSDSQSSRTSASSRASLEETPAQLRSDVEGSLGSTAD